MNVFKKAHRKKESNTPINSLENIFPWTFNKGRTEEQTLNEKQILKRLILIEKESMAEIVNYDYKNNNVILKLNKAEAQKFFEIIQEIGVTSDDLKLPAELKLGTSNRFHGWLTAGTINSQDVELILKLKKDKKDKLVTIKQAFLQQIRKQYELGIPGYARIKIIPSVLKAKSGKIILKKKERELKVFEADPVADQPPFENELRELYAALAETNYALFIEGKDEAVQLEHYRLENVSVKVDLDTKGRILVKINEPSRMIPYLRNLQSKYIKVANEEIYFKSYGKLVEEMIAMTEPQVGASATQPITMKAMLERTRKNQREFKIGGATIENLQFDRDTETLSFTIGYTETDIYEAKEFIGMVDITRAKRAKPKDIN